MFQKFHWSNSVVIKKRLMMLCLGPLVKYNFLAAFEKSEYNFFLLRKSHLLKSLLKF